MGSGNQFRPSALLLAFLAGCAWAQPDSAALPRFEDYPAGAILTATPVAPNLTTLERRYADEIRDQYEVIRDGQQRGPNFAGHFIVIQWGCGAPCMRMAIVDARNGDVHHPPISINGIGARSFDLPLLIFRDSVAQNPEVQFRPNSNLMIIKATPNNLARNPLAYTYYFLWRQNRWTLRRRVPLD